MRKFKLEQKEFSDINITPFTDVVLVLLIIFMIASPVIITGAFQIKLPKAAGAENAPKKKVEVFLTAENEIYIDNLPVPPRELKGALTAAMKKSNSTDVVVNADKEVKHGAVVDLLDALKKCGAVKLMIGTEKK